MDQGFVRPILQISFKNITNLAFKTRKCHKYLSRGEVVCYLQLQLIVLSISNIQNLLLFKRSRLQSESQSRQLDRALPVHFQKTSVCSVDSVHWMKVLLGAIGVHFRLQFGPHFACRSRKVSRDRKEALCSSVALGPDKSMQLELDRGHKVANLLVLPGDLLLQPTPVQEISVPLETMDAQVGGIYEAPLLLKPSDSFKFNVQVFHNSELTTMGSG